MPLQKMNPKVKARWVKALRSGKYKQGKKALRTGDSYCCLGVLCALAVRSKVIPPPTRYSDGEFQYDNWGGELPPVVQEWSGVDSSDPCIRTTGTKTTASEINDSGRYDFNKIADMIEANL